MKIFKPKFWHKKNSLISYSLLPFSFLFQFLIILKKIFTRKRKFSIPVICVGNIYLGGTGKTPLCIEIAQILKKYNKKVALIKKFYSSHQDEFELIESKNITLFKDSSRVKAIEKAQIDKFDCAVLDDGFQDSSVFKDLNIICFNQDQLIGNGMSIPSGPLREPFSSIKNSQIILINGESNESFEKKIKAVSKNISIYYSNYVPTNLNYFKDQNLLAFAGIGNPDNFFSLLEKNNLNIIKKIPFPDHYQYTIKELNDLVNFSAKNNLKIITTEKDYCRIKNYNIQQIQYLHVDLEIKNKEEFAREVVRCLH